MGDYEIGQVRDTETNLNVVFGHFPVKIKSNRILIKVDNIIVIPFKVIVPSHNSPNAFEVTLNSNFHTMTIGAKKRGPKEQLLLKTLSKLYAIRWDKGNKQVRLISKEHTILLNPVKSP
jgi:hypothetical protein